MTACSGRAISTAARDIEVGVAYRVSLFPHHHFFIMSYRLVPVSQALRENTYPFLAFILLKENRMTVVGRIEGVTSKCSAAVSVIDLISPLYIAYNSF